MWYWLLCHAYVGFIVIMLIVQYAVQDRVVCVSLANLHPVRT